MMRRFLYNNIGALIILCCLGFIIYSNTFHSSFHFDDSSAIVNNPAIRNLANLKAIWNFYPTRVVTFLTFALNYHFSKLNVVFYHVFNLAVHLGAAISVFWLTTLIFSVSLMKKGTLFKYANSIALFVALIFLSHPVQTESVTFIWQRSTSLAGFFYLFSLCLYVKARLLQLDAKHIFKANLFIILSYVFYVLCIFTKEISASLPLIIILLEIYFFNKDRRANGRYILYLLITALVIPLSIFFNRSEGFIIIQKLMDKPIYNTGSYFLTQFNVILTYIRILFVPFNQNLDYDYPIAKGLMDPGILCSLFVLIGIIAGGIRLFSRYRLLSFGIFWFFITVFLESSVIPLNDAIFEHRLYLPMVGYGFFLTGIIYYRFSAKNIRPASAILIAFVALYSMLTYARNFVWKNEITLWSDVIHKSPHKDRGYINLGNAYKDKGDFDQAISAYRKAIELRYNSGAYSNLGAIYLKMGKIDLAEEMIKKAIEIAPGLAGAYNNLAIVYNRSGRREEAIAVLMKALKINPVYPDTYYNMGFIYSGMGKDREAVESYKKAIILNPYDPYVHCALAEAYYRLKEYRLSIEHCDKVIELGYQVDPAFLNLIRPYRGREKRGNM